VHTLFGLNPVRGYFKPALDLQLPAPSLTLSQFEARGALIVGRGVLRTGRDGARLGLGTQRGGGVESVRILGQELFAGSIPERQGVTFAHLWRYGARETPIEIAWDPAAGPAIYLMEQSALPESSEARSLLAARPTNAVPADRGDASLVGVKVNLQELMIESGVTESPPSE
jgi:hypothetical protein